MEDGVLSEEWLLFHWYPLSSVPFCDSHTRSIMCPLQVAAEDRPLPAGVFVQNGLEVDTEDNCMGCRGSPAYSAAKRGSEIWEGCNPSFPFLIWAIEISECGWRREMFLLSAQCMFTEHPCVWVSAIRNAPKNTRKSWPALILLVGNNTVSSLIGYSIDIKPCAWSCWPTANYMLKLCHLAIFVIGLTADNQV